MTITIPCYRTITLEHIVLDYNGTIATDGILTEKIKTILHTLSQKYTLHVITADTFGSVKEEVRHLNIQLKVLTSNDHTTEKAHYIQSLDASRCVAIGNGNNDRDMLKAAALGIAIIAEEGCATATLLQSDIVCTDILNALELLNSPKRLIATLRH